VSDVTDLTSAPKPFDGTSEERAANYATHSFGGDDGRCFFCDCKPWHLSASYPCGATVPRTTMSEAEYAVRTGGHGAAYATSEEEEA